MSEPNIPIPSSGGMPILGAAIPLLRDPLAYLRRKYAQLGPVFSVRAATRRFVVLAGAEANRFVATTGRDAFRSGPFWGPLAKRWGSDNAMIAIDGPDHIALRKMFRNDVSRAVVQRGAADAERLICAELGAALDNGPIVVRDLARLLVSREVHHLLTDGDTPVVLETVQALMEVFRWDTNTLLLGKWPRFALYAPSYRRQLALAQRFVTQLIERTEQRTPESGWLKTTIDGRHKRPDLFTPGDVRMSFMLPFVAGVDTVGSTISFLLYELLRDPDLYALVESAVDSLYAENADRLSDIETLRANDDLRGLVLETLRLYPAAFALYRTTAEPVQFAGYRIPEQSEVVVFTSASHTDPRLFAEPYRFDIRRFREPRLEHKQKFAFAPYGGGPHVCLGAGMGEALLVLNTAVLLHHFRLEAEHPGREFSADFDPSLVMPAAFRIRASRRQH